MGDGDLGGPDGPRPMEAPRTQDPGGHPGRGLRWALGGAAIVIVVAILGGAFLLGRSGGDDPIATPAATDSTTPPTAAPTTATPLTAAPEPVVDEPAPPPTASAAPPSTLGDVRNAAAGLQCKDLESMGYSYSAAVDYWRVFGQPNAMDADKNGIPCETVYSLDDVTRYWGSSYSPPGEGSGHIGYVSPENLEYGLRCQDLYDRGYDTFDALTYYYAHDMPAIMDADGNGVPCETVFPDAYAVARDHFSG